MRFSGFDRSALDELRRLPSLDVEGYAVRRQALSSGLVVPARALVAEVASRVDAPLTTPVSPLHADLRFAPAGAPRFKDHLLLTAWHGADRRTGPMLWIRIDSASVGFASGIAFIPAVRQRWRAAVGGAPGTQIATLLDGLGMRHGRHNFEIAGDTVRRVPAPWTDEHPRAELLRCTAFQVRFRFRLPRDAEHAGFAAWCAERWSELLPVHRWLVKNLCVKDQA